MKQNYLKSFCARCVTLLVLALLSANYAWGAEAALTSVSTKNVVGTKGQSVSMQFGDVTCKVTRNSGNEPGFYTSSGIVRYYNTDVMTLSVPSGSTISKIVFVMNSGTVGTASPTGLSSDSKTWTGSANSVSFTGSATVKITSITVTYSSGTSSKTLVSIAISGNPTKTEYKEGESFDPAGLVVTGTYDVGEPQTITEGIEWVVNPETFETAGTFSVDVIASVGDVMSDVYTVENIKVVEIPYIFYESFNQTSGTGGNDGQWSGSIASSTLTSDNKDWTFVKQGGANKCAKFGSGSDKGSATTPALGYAGDAVISFKAAAWNGGSEGTTLNISVVGGGTVGSSSVTLVKGAWTTYQLSLSNLTNDSKIKFEAANKSNNRFFLDEIMIVRAGASKEVAISSAGWATVCLPFKTTITSDNATAYYVTGTNDAALVKTEATVIPADEGVLLKSNNGGEATVTFTISAEDATAATGNLMKGSLIGETFNNTDYKYYILAKDETHGLGFYYQVEGGVSAICAAGKAVLAVPTTPGAKEFFSLDGEPTGITSYENDNDNENLKAMTVYNLNGMKVNNSYKGIVIMNGKKYINK